MKKYLFLILILTACTLIFVLNCQERPIEQSSSVTMYVASFQPTLAYSLTPTVISDSYSETYTIPGSTPPTTSQTITNVYTSYYAVVQSSPSATNANIHVLLNSEIGFNLTGVSITKIRLEGHDHDTGEILPVGPFEYHVTAYIPINDNDDTTEIDNIPIIYDALGKHIYGDNYPGVETDPSTSAQTVKFTADIPYYDLYITFEGLDSSGHSVKCNGVATILCYDSD